jgi:small subunit ribosomal protein S1
MSTVDFAAQLQDGTIEIPRIKSGEKTIGTVIKRGDYWVLVNCAGGVFTWLILSKEVKNLERSGEDLAIGAELEAEILGSDVVTDEWYYVISISKLKQQDLRKKILNQKEKDEILTVIPTEANLWWLLVDMHGIKWFIPLSQLAPIHYPRVEDGDQEKIFDELLKLLGKEINVRIINFDEDARRMILSEREGLREARNKIMETIKVWDEFDGVISGISSYGFFVTIGGDIEWLVHISEITYGHVSNIDWLGEVWDPMKVKVIGLEWGKISLSHKQLRPDPWTIIPQQYWVGDIIEGEVVRYVPYGVFIRVYDDINGLIHLSEIGDLEASKKSLKIGSIINVKVILLEPRKRKIGLSLKGMVIEDIAVKSS